MEDNNTEFKAGHAPAAKVGNMRVAGHRTRNTSSGSGEKLNAEELRKQEAEYGTEVDEAKQGQVVAGSLVKEDKAFTPDAVKAYHDKPVPKHEKPHAPPAHNIHQPRK
ncbi:hypothetical protein BOX15_Mlig023356g3 [Macrostomum lignano]|uniref:Uncharacterized protein n=1 Tax=Macrostomum lignano TaxID=282301 RepID=A0A267DLG0_9PLAT|nr:hypothetical protein BOX15_Mlig023356g3 [Macrostomum lignano]